MDLSLPVQVITCSRSQLQANEMLSPGSKSHKLSTQATLKHSSVHPNRHIPQSVVIPSTGNMMSTSSICLSCWTISWLGSGRKPVPNRETRISSACWFCPSQRDAERGRRRTYKRRSMGLTSGQYQTRCAASVTSLPSTILCKQSMTYPSADHLDGSLQELPPRLLLGSGSILGK